MMGKSFNERVRITEVPRADWKIGSPKKSATGKVKRKRDKAKIKAKRKAARKARIRNGLR
jgi:hypothetical protein